MKKLLLLILVTILPIISFSQIKKAGVYVTTYDNKSKYPTIGVGVNLFIYNSYIGLSSNFAKGIGTELEFNSSYTYKTNKISSTGIIGGHIFYIKNTNWYVIPELGIFIESDIYEDTLLFNSYYNDNYRGKLHGGILIGFDYNNVGFFFGGGNYELFKIGITIK